MIQNPMLKAQDKVALCCPGSICLAADHPRIAADYLQSHYALQSVIGPETTQWMSPRERADIFLQYLFDDSIKLITTLRGGEGSADLLPYIHVHADKIRAMAAKPLLGYSDFTPILVYFAQCFRWPVIHGCGPSQFSREVVDAESAKVTMDLLFGELQAVSLEKFSPLNDAARSTQTIQAELTGGCLSLIDISIKDIWEIDTENKIIFFEDVSEKAHKINRTLKYFSRIGLFDKAKAVVFGDFNCEPIGAASMQQKNRQAIDKVLARFAEQHDIPVLHTTQFGHGKTNFPLIYATDYCLELGDQPRLVLS